MGSSTEAPSGTARMRPGSPIWHCHPPSTAFRGPMGSSTEAPGGTARIRPGSPMCHLSSTQYS
eukprot:5260109-Pyramimonas_sp.AAC.1